MSDQGWEIDDYDDEDYWDDDPFYEDEPSEPDCWCSDVHDCWTCYPQPLRVRRRASRRWRMEQRRRRQLLRHTNDWFWQVRNRASYDGEAPF